MAFHLLHERIQRFIWGEQWESLREIQLLAIPPILEGKRDLIIAAATASGKTEAAFLPALTSHLETDCSTLIVYVSPLKALINDQFSRLERLCDDLEVSVAPWHGDISWGTKRKFIQDPHGVLLITPESLEATLCNKGTQTASLFDRTAFFIVDELHAFIGTERGKQLQSLLHRIELSIGRRVPRIGLSATLGDMELAKSFLRPREGSDVIVISSQSESSDLQVRVFGFEEPHLATNDGDSPTEEVESPTPGLIAASLFTKLRTDNNLVFPNSRREVERYTYLLNRLCDDARVPQVFWPHHGSLSADLRRETEEALKNGAMPATAICTNSLELGIDVGKVESVTQIGPAPSVSSLRQRVGRSGRRPGRPARLRGYVIENAMSANAPLRTALREALLEMTASIQLLIEKWCEPPRPHAVHYSTLIQQMLSLIAERGGAMLGALFSMLCGNSAPFEGVEKADFIELVREMGRRDLVVQDSSGLLLHGAAGEKFVNHHSFYAAFSSEEEFRVVTTGRTLGSLPISTVLLVSQFILFAGRTWRIESVDEDKKEIFVVDAPGGRAPPFNKGHGRVHTTVRQTMLALLQGTAEPTFLDPTALRFLDQARHEFRRLELDTRRTLRTTTGLMIPTWRGDDTNDAIVCILQRHGIASENHGLGVEISSSGVTEEALFALFAEVAKQASPTPSQLLVNAQNLRQQKWDWALPQHILERSFAEQALDIESALEWVRVVSRGR